MILYEDKEILVCRKSSGIAVQSARLGEKDLVSILNNHLAEQAELKQYVFSDGKRAKGSKRGQTVVSERGQVRGAGACRDCT